MKKELAMENCCISVDVHLVKLVPSSSEVEPAQTYINIYIRTYILLCTHVCTHIHIFTVIMIGANEYMLDEMDRALHDSLCVVKRMLESNTLVPGTFRKLQWHMHITFIYIYLYIYTYT